MLLRLAKPQLRVGGDDGNTSSDVLERWLESVSRVQKGDLGFRAHGDRLNNSKTCFKSHGRVKRRTSEADFTY